MPDVAALARLKRAELNARATAAGVPAPERLPNKQTVIDAIAARDTKLSAVDAVERDLAKISEVDPDLARSGLAAVAQALARELDDDDASTTSKLAAAKGLIEALDRLREQLPEPEQEGDPVDAIRRDRAKRLAGRPAA